MSESTFEATTVEDALEQAAAQLGAGQDELEYEVVEEKQDFWGTGGGTVVVKAWTRAPEPVEAEVATPTAADTEPAEAADTEAPPAADTEATEADAPVSVEALVEGAVVAPEATDEHETQAADSAAGGNFWDTENEAPDVDGNVATEADEPSAPPEMPSDEPAEKAVQDTVEAAPVAADDKTPTTSEPAADVSEADIVTLIDQIFHDMEFDCSAEVTVQPDGFLAAVSGDDKDFLLEGSGRGLSALELILNNAFRHKLERGHKVRVDAGDFRSRRDDELSNLAFQVAHSAKEAGRTQETQPLNPYERRLVHLALAEDPTVTTRSRGSGFLKNVQVIPNR